MLKKDGLFIWGYFAWLEVQIILDTMYFQSQIKHKITSKITGPPSVYNDYVLKRKKEIQQLILLRCSNF